MIESYDLYFDVDFPRAIITGLVTIHLVEAEDPVELDAEALTIKRVSIDGRDTSYDYDQTKGVLRLSGLPKGKLAIEIAYEKRVPDHVIFGIYKSRYVANHMLVTDLEPTGARTVFPCKDDPAYKANFNVTVVTEKGLAVISNTQVKTTEDTSDGRRKFVFHPTPKMSTYLLFLGIGKFEEISRSSDGIDVIVATRPTMSKKGAFILNDAVNVLKEFARYFGIPYPLEKLHLIALPELQGAMENWGSITSREAFILVDEASSTSDRMNAAYVMAHEISHQWFGDLVTMKWWDDLWLNESFATFMGYKVTNILHPEWDIWSDFLHYETFRSISVDVLATTHPIEARVNTPDEIKQVFDNISYGKGASVLRMIEFHVGEETFRKGVSDYLRLHSYSNAAGADLWNSLEKTSGQPVSEIMEAWIRKPGLPLVTVEARDGKLVFGQRRLLLSGADRQAIWPIPIAMELNEETKKFLFTGRTYEMQVPSISRLKVNVDQVGYYCVLYDASTYDLLAKEFSSLSGRDKAGVVNDLYQLLRAGTVDPRQYFRFISLCGNEKDFPVVHSITPQLSLLNCIAAESNQLRAASLAFLRSQIARLGISSREGEGETEGILREEVAIMLAQLDDDFARELSCHFPEYNSMDPNIRAAVAIAYARTNGGNAFEPLLQMVKGLENEVDRQKIYHGLAWFKEPRLVEKTLEFGISGEVSRSDSAWTWMYSSLNPHARRVTWTWIKNTFDRLWELYSGSPHLFLLLQAAVPRCAVEEEEDASAFFSGDRLMKGEMVFKRTLELLHVNARLRKRLLG